MNESAQLLAKYPLSPKKFWKKFLPRFISSAIFTAIACGVVVLVAGAGDNSGFAGWIAVALVVLFVIVQAIRAGYIKAYIRSYFYDGNADYLTIRKGVFTPTEIHVQYMKFQDVYVDQDLFDRIMGLYDVHIASATYTSGIEAHIDGVEKEQAESLKAFLLGRMTGKGSGMPGEEQMEAPRAPMQGPISAPLGAKLPNSDTYPISGRWIAQSALSSIFAAGIMVFFAGTFLFSHGKTGNSPSFAEALSLSTGFAVFLLAILFLAIYFVIIATSLVWKKNFRFEFLPDSIRTFSKIIAQKESHIPYSSIQDVVVKQGIVERLFGLATVYVQNATSVAYVGRGRAPIQAAVTIPGQSLSAANEIADAVKSIALSRGQSRTGI